MTVILKRQLRVASEILAGYKRTYKEVFESNTKICMETMTTTLKQQIIGYSYTKQKLRDAITNLRKALQNMRKSENTHLAHISTLNQDVCTAKKDLTSAKTQFTSINNALLSVVLCMNKLSVNLQQQRRVVAKAELKEDFTTVTDKVQTIIAE